jgi:hypothetical protein
MCEVCDEDIAADIKDFEEMLGALVRLEDPCLWRDDEEEVPRVHYMRQMVFECLEPLWLDETNVNLRRRMWCLLDALLASETLHMCEEELRSFCAGWASAEQRRNSHVFVELARKYSVEFGLHDFFCVAAPRL